MIFRGFLTLVSERNSFNCEINMETYQMILEILKSNTNNIELFSFQDSGMAKIIKKNNNSLNLSEKIITRKLSIKNITRKIIYR